MSNFASTLTAYVPATGVATSVTPAVARTTESSRTLAGLLLAAGFSALLVVANELIDTYTEGHLLAGWVALWVVAFGVIAFFAPRMRFYATKMALAYERRAAAAKERQIEEELWEHAHHDPRLMEDLMQAWERTKA